MFLLFSQDLTTAKLVFVVASLSCKKFNITGSKHTNTTTKRFRTLEHREQIYVYTEMNYQKTYMTKTTLTRYTHYLGTDSGLAIAEEG